MLNKKQKKCVELLISGKFKQAQVAEQCDVTRETVNKWLNHNEEFKKEYEKAMSESIQSLAPKAKYTMSKLLDAESENVRFQAAKDILDRTGFKPKEQVEISKPVDESIKEMDEYLCKKKAEDT